jgi:general secretion pathway protein F
VALFAYTGIDKSGQKVKGVIEIENLRSARLKLKSTGVYPTKVIEKSASDAQKRTSFLQSFTQRVKIDDIVAVTQQLTVLINAHVPLVNGLTAVVEQAENPKLKSILADIKQKVNEGTSFGEALGAYPDVFSSIYINLVKAGEASGTLGKVMERLAEFTQAQYQLRSKVKSAMTYPLAMAAIGGAALILIFSFVVPKITKVLEDQNLPLPIYTELLIGLSSFLRDYWYLVIIGIILFAVLFRLWIRTTEGRIKWDTIMLRLPVLGDLNRKVAVSRFSKTLATLLSGGVKILEAIDIAKLVVDNKVFEKVLSDARDDIEEGESIADPLAKSGEFPPIVSHMIAIGEKTGSLESMLENVSNSYDREVENALDALTSLLEPIMIVVMGITVGFVVISILVPMMQMTNIQ